MGKTILTFLLILLAIFGVTAIIQEKNKNADLARMSNNAVTMVAQEAENMAEKAKNEADTKGSALAEAAKVKAEAIRQDLKKAGEKAGERAEVFKDEMGKKASELGDKAAEAGKNASDKTSNAIHEIQVKRSLEAKPNLGKQWKVIGKADKPNSWKVKNGKTGKIYRVSSQMVDDTTKKTIVTELKTGKVFKEFTSQVQ